jgi:hypothetical protein
LRRTARRAKAIDDAFTRSVANGLLVGLAAFSISSFLLSTETSRVLWLIVGLSLALPRIVSAQAREHSRIRALELASAATPSA